MTGNADVRVLCPEAEGKEGLCQQGVGAENAAGSLYLK